MTAFALTFNVGLLSPPVVTLSLLFGLGAYLWVTGQSIGRPRPDLGERLQRLDVDHRMRLLERSQHARRPLFSSRLLEGLLRPMLEDAGRLARGGLARLGLAGGRELERRLQVARPGVEPIQFYGEKLAVACIVGLIFP
ncbi:MAG: hypothetical protein JO023_02795, partial [Chloroflexi bacterium]|nr:hypothetical protein [Chloroflexota bacterium]